MSTYIIIIMEGGNALESREILIYILSRAKERKQNFRCSDIAVPLMDKQKSRFPHL